MGCLVRCVLVPLLSHLTVRNKQSSPTKLLWLPSYEATTTLPQGPKFLRTLSIMNTRALTVSSLAQGVSSPPAASGDVSVLLQMSAVLLMAYWITNFVVPDIISEALQFDKPSKDQIPEDKIPSQDD
ncbi:uncharacterized protein LOC122642890 [Telopea speciosissima]|uniref:uncharacterized protein LOC122642890 n=1 Tax=Telopea speciosissima TaxID=54955 RepID=UPI001CC5DC96|nr:uncharacterized protein LOC122642890 [Telopea speciosissima]